jgi:DtxR family Mn-dependent transcriptional regulator
MRLTILAFARGVDLIPDSKKLSASMQDYLEAILELEEAEDTVRVTDIANKLGIAKASVNQTLNKFKKKGLVRQKIYGPVELTREGRHMAEKVRQAHLLLKRFLIQVLDVDPEVAEEDACLMEHAVSTHTMERLTDFLRRNGYLKEQNSAPDK